MIKKSHQIRNRYLFLADFILCVAAYAFMIAFVFKLSLFKAYFLSGIEFIGMTGVIYASYFILFSVYNTDWVHAGHRNYTSLLAACVCASFTSVFIGIILNSFFLKFNIIANIAITAVLCGIRFLLRIMNNSLADHNSGTGKRTLIIGAGRLAIMLLRDIAENSSLNYNIVGLIDDDPNKTGMRIYGTKVLGTRADIERLCKELDIEEIIFAIYSISPKQKSELLDICSNTEKKVKILPGVEESLSGFNQLKKIREINIEDLLEREPIKLDNNLIENDINGKTILVTGGGGSIGSELCRQILRYSPKRLIILDIYENTTYEVQHELKEAYPDQKIDVLIASVRDKKRLDEIFEYYHPDIVFHTAAHKHVPLMEFSPSEAIKNNVFGTYNTALCASEHNVKRFIMISTDKAVNPTNIMGASKRMCEMIVQTLNQKSSTDFVAVRFGNVLGSHGSVIPLFKKQIAKGGPVTVTHPEITRFFMTIPEAAQLVLQAASYAEGGEIFVLDMGQPVKIYHLAKKLITLSGFKPGKDIKIEFTGLRPGEKLYEELLMDEEGLKKTAHSKIFVGQPIDITPEELQHKLNILKDSLADDSADLKAVMAEVVSTYSYHI